MCSFTLNITKALFHVKHTKKVKIAMLLIKRSGAVAACLCGRAFRSDSIKLRPCTCRRDNTDIDSRATRCKRPVRAFTGERTCVWHALKYGLYIQEPNNTCTIDNEHLKRRNERLVSEHPSILILRKFSRGIPPRENYAIPIGKTKHDYLRKTRMIRFSSRDINNIIHTWLWSLCSSLTLGIVACSE